MNLYYIQHIFFETPAAILYWCKDKNISCYRFNAYKDEINNLKIESSDILLIMGGPMGVYEEDKFPYLKEEKKLIEKALKFNKKIIGICLGAQLIADVLGAKVYQNKYKEIGWFPVYSTKESKQLFSFLPDSFFAFHWHGDTFELPKNSVHLFFNQATTNQGFIYNTALALQFHLESTEESIHDIYLYSKQDIENAKDKTFIQEFNEKENKKHINQSNQLLFSILDNFIYSL